MTKKRIREAFAKVLKEPNFHHKVIQQRNIIKNTTHIEDELLENYSKSKNTLVVNIIKFLADKSSLNALYLKDILLHIDKQANTSKVFETSRNYVDVDNKHLAFNVPQ